VTGIFCGSSWTNSSRPPCSWVCPRPPLALTPARMSPCSPVRRYAPPKPGCMRGTTSRCMWRVQGECVGHSHGWQATTAATATATTAATTTTRAISITICASTGLVQCAGARQFGARGIACTPSALKTERKSFSRRLKTSSPAWRTSQTSFAATSWRFAP